MTIDIVCVYASCLLSEASMFKLTIMHAIGKSAPLPSYTKIFIAA